MCPQSSPYTPAFIFRLIEGVFEMNRFESTTHPGMYWAIGISMLLVFAIDLQTVIGVATWILYLVPLVLCFRVSKPWLPPLVASLCTVLMVIDWFVSAPGISEQIAQLNRGLGIVVMWAAAFMARSTMMVRLQLRRDEWLRTARTRIADVVVGEQNLKLLSERVLGVLADYLGAQAAAMYVTEASGAFARVGAIGLPADSVSPTVFRPDEGLLGRAVTEKRAIRLEDLPPDYLKIESSLGNRRPSALLIAPLNTEDTAQGVIELGFLHPTFDTDLELLNTVSEPIAIAIRTGMLRRERESLLRETQRQSEELQAQQEELRVANEELMAQGSQLRESQAQLETQQAELEQTNVQLEEHAQKLARQHDELVDAKLDLERKAEDLTRANRYKSEFLANMSHELRTPLNSSLILAKLLADNRDGNLTPEQVKFARGITAAGNDLLSLINDILDLSKIEARKVEVSRSAVDLGELVERLSQTFEPVAEQKQVLFRTVRAADLPATIDTDSQRLSQVLKNLLSNAIKFTERGTVTLEITTHGDDVQFAVRDTGIGIASEHQQAIFEPFRQADGTTNRKFGGTGLGLSISRELARMLGGEITVESMPGEGSTFRLVLPRVTPPLVREASPPAAPLQTLPAAKQKSPGTPATPRRANIPDDRARITDDARVLLVIEDDPAFARILYDLAHELGFDCLIAGSADEGMELASQFRLAAVVLDIKLPDHSGLTVLDRLKHNPMTRHVPVQVISGQDNTRAARQMGAAGALVKPVDRDALLSTLAGLKEKFASELRSVLIVEDNALQRESICQLLGSDTTRTIAVDNAASALEQLRTTTFDCMVLDLSLPDATGHELLERMAADESYAFPPVIVYTGRTISAEEEQQLRKYSRSIIIKGAKSPERLLDEVSLFLHQVEEKLPPDRQRMLRDARARDAAFEGRRILVVEDDVRNIFALSSVLEPLGGTLVIARNGREALAKLDSKPLPDIVLMDIMMPEMDGIEATQEIRKRADLADLPIIALTAKAMPDDQQRCLAAGANDYVTKPIDVDKLTSLIRIWIAR
jgi:signal transduction histidine kinase/CheY-like chemotaxis protein